MGIRALHHVQLAMPKTQEEAAIAFYQGLLGFTKVAKPPILAARGGVWFERGQVRVHLGVEDVLRPARKAHPAFEGGYIEDPFGNRIELLEPMG